MIMKSNHLARLDLNLLKVFAAIYRERHITRAGRSLFITQSAVSHSLSNLRRVFRDPLFVRTPGGMQPTALADRLADPIRKALQCVNDAMQVDERFDPATAEVEFSIGTTVMQPFHFLPDFYRRIEQQAPLANLLIRSFKPDIQELLEAVDRGDIDVLLTVADDDTRGALTQRFMSADLFEDPLVCVVSRNNPDVGETLDIETYARLPHLIMASDRVAGTWIDSALEERGLRRRIAVTAPHPYAIPVLIGGTRLVSTVARSLVSRFVEPSGLRMIKPPIQSKPHRFRMVWSTRTDRDPALMWLRETIRESCRMTEESQLRDPPMNQGFRAARATTPRRRHAQQRARPNEP